MRDWIKAALIRAVKTFAESMIGCITVGAAISDINWVHALSVSAVATILSILWSIKGLPEVDAQRSLELVREGILPVQESRNEDKED